LIDCSAEIRGNKIIVEMKSYGFIPMLTIEVLYIIGGRVMTWLFSAFALVLGFILGFSINLIFKKGMKTEFESLSLNALSKSRDELLKLAKEKFESEREINIRELDNKKNLIDQHLTQMTSKLDSVESKINDFETQRSRQYGDLSSTLKSTNDKTSELAKLTNDLKQALSSSRVRGQWGQRMAEDILRISGFIEGINYYKEKTITEIGTRPDFTFLLPKDLKLNMDVKFPYDNYVKFIEADNEGEMERYRKDFFRDVKSKIKDVQSRDYINPEQNTLDYVLLFIPNEQIYAFIHDQDETILDEGLKNKVVFCSPITLFAILAVIRQSVDNFAIEKASGEIVSLLSAFRKQWEKYTGKMTNLGSKIEAVQKEYEFINSTRKRMLDKQLDKIEELRQQRNIPDAHESIADDEDL